MIEIKELMLRAGNFELSIELQINKNSYFVLLGMTGSGKTLLLECICGLRPPLSGTIIINGRDITRIDPSERHIGYVPQEGALFNHLSVDDNIAFGLQIAKFDKATIRNRVMETAQQLCIVNLLGRPIKGLSGGERQRVALARAIICKPSVLLLDEPVCALDEFTRESVCRELKRIQRELAIPVIHVCHSFEEAALLADTIGIMQLGRIIQTGTIGHMQRYPVDQYVARMLKLDNIFKGTVCDSWHINCNGLLLNAKMTDGNNDFVIRPWQIVIQDEPINGCDNTITGKISEIHNVGHSDKIRIDSQLPLVFYTPRLESEKRGLSVGKEVMVSFPVDAVHVFEKKE